MKKVKKADLTAIIPVYNGIEFIRKAVESVINQTLPPKQLIIVDDGSTDGSIDIIKGIKAPFPIMTITQKNSGQSSARNKGIGLSKTSFIALLDQDDYWFPRHNEVLIKPLLDDSSVGWVYGNVNLVDLEGKTFEQGVLDTSPITHPKRQLHVCLSEDMFILPSASIIRKEAFDRICGFDERLSGYEDDDLFLRLFRDGWKNIYVDDTVLAWRIHDTSTMFSERMLRSRRIYAAKLFREYPDRPELNRFYSSKLIAPRFYRMVNEEYWRGLRIKNYALCRESLTDMINYSSYYSRGVSYTIKFFLMRFPRLMTVLAKILRNTNHR